MARLIAVFVTATFADLFSLKLVLVLVELVVKLFEKSRVVLARLIVALAAATFARPALFHAQAPDEFVMVGATTKGGPH